MMLRTRCVNKYAQGGSALIVSLVFLLLLTILGASAMRSSVFQERMAGSTRDTNLAFQAAEAALRAGENILNPNALPIFDNSVAGYRQQIDKMKGDYWSTYKWDDVAAVNGGSQQYAGAIAGVAELPRFVIEQLKSEDVGGSAKGGTRKNQFTYYRVTARGVGQSRDSVVILQSTYKIMH